MDQVDVLLRTFDPNGNPLTGVVRVNPDTIEGQFPGEVVALPGGGFLVTYISFDRREDFADLYVARGRVYDAAGRPVTDAFDISEFVYEDMGRLGTILLKDGTLVVGWEGGGIIEEDVFAQVLGQGGAADDSFTAVLPGLYRGFGGDDLIFGSGGDDTLTGDQGNDGLGGGAGRDLLQGGAGDDILFGNLGADALVGGQGADVFLYLLGTESRRGERDHIADFTPADRIDFSFIDTNLLLAGDQGFTFIGAAAFSGAAAELRYVRGTLSADLDGNGRAELIIVVDGAPTLTAGDLVL